MFINFFFQLRDAQIPVTPTAFLTFQRALDKGLIGSLSDLYSISRAILVKSERYFDRFDQLFAAYFKGADLPDWEDAELDEMVRAMLQEWLKDPKQLADVLDISEEELAKLTPEELLEYFKQRLEDQTERHDGGNRWIGTGGTSPVGHSGYHPEGMRVGGVSRSQSAVKVALERRYRDYAGERPLTADRIGEALKRLRHLRPEGPKDQVNIDKTIYETMRNGGEIEIVFDRRLKDRLKIVLAIDNGGWSMDPHIGVIQTLFDYARASFKDLKIYYFHNTIYDAVWKDPQRYRQPVTMAELGRLDPETRVFIVGDASMAPYELMASNGSLYVGERSGRASLEQLQHLAKTFRHSVWLNPIRASRWGFTPTIQKIRETFPMFELSLTGLSKAVQHLSLN